VTALKVLFIGGSGQISSACARRAVDLGIDLHVLNRGRTSARPLPAGARRLEGDIRDPASARAAIGDREFDAVVDFVAFTPEHVQLDVDLFAGRTGQFVFISSASAYQKPRRAPADRRVDAAAQPGLALLAGQDRVRGPPGAHVPRGRLPGDDRAALAHLRPQESALRRRLDGRRADAPGPGGRRPRRRHVAVDAHTHHADFAKAFVGLLGHPQAIGDSFHITSDEVLTWNQIYELVGAAAGVRPRLVHVASEAIFAADQRWGRSLLGDKAHSVRFDNAKVKALVPDYVATIPFAQGAREIVAWHDEDPARRIVDERVEALMDELVARYGRGS
jgi:nucleoside-diphosphate-sugar epimerase